MCCTLIACSVAASGERRQQICLGSKFASIANLPRQVFGPDFDHVLQRSSQCRALATAAGKLRFNAVCHWRLCKALAGAICRAAIAVQQDARLIPMYVPQPASAPATTCSMVDSSFRDGNAMMTCGLTCGDGGSEARIAKARTNRSMPSPTGLRARKQFWYLEVLVTMEIVILPQQDNFDPNIFQIENKKDDSNPIRNKYLFS